MGRPIIYSRVKQLLNLSGESSHKLHKDCVTIEKEQDLCSRHNCSVPGVQVLLRARMRVQNPKATCLSCFYVSLHKNSMYHDFVRLFLLCMFVSVVWNVSVLQYIHCIIVARSFRLFIIHLVYCTHTVFNLCESISQIPSVCPF